jgi:short-subunit dehydrogenase
VVLVARRPEPLAELATSLPTRTLPVEADLATPAGVAAVIAACSDLPIGLVVANAAYSPIGSFVELGRDDLVRALDLNCRAPLLLARHFAPAMVERGRGGLVVMSSLSGLQGSPPISVYAATKAFGIVLAEGLWAELRGTGVDVVACVAGAIATPGLASALSSPGRRASRSGPRQPPGTLSPERVAEAALRGLGRGPRVVPGLTMRFSAALMSRLPRRAAIQIISRASRDLVPADPAAPEG